MRFSALVSACLFTAVLFTGCTGQPTKTQAAEDAPKTPETKRLYSTLNEAASQHSRGLKSWQAGLKDIGSKQMRESVDRIQTAAKQCAAQRDCDINLFTDVLYGLLLQHNELAPGTPQSTGSTPQRTVVKRTRHSPNRLNGKPLRDVIVINEAVQGGLSEWLTWLRPNLMEAYENYQYLRAKMWPEYEKAGLPEALLFGIMAQESGGRVHSVSSAGASGLLQFMPATGARFGLGKNAQGFDTRFDPKMATQANVAYLKERFDELDGDLPKAVAAYNGGEGRMRRIHRSMPNKGFWDPAVFKQIPSETQKYVPMVLAAAWLYMHPEEYGLVFPDIDDRLKQVTLNKPASLYELTICLGHGHTREGWFRALRNLNPQHDPNVRLGKNTRLWMPQEAADAYPVYCIAGDMAQKARQLSQAKIPSTAHFIGKHGKSSTKAAKRRTTAKRTRSIRVKKGDTLHSISRRHQCTVSTLAKANRLKAPKYTIKRGQLLKLQGCKK